MRLISFDEMREVYKIICPEIKKLEEQLKRTNEFYVALKAENEKLKAENDRLIKTNQQYQENNAWYEENYNWQIKRNGELSVEIRLLKAQLQNSDKASQAEHCEVSGVKLDYRYAYCVCYTCNGRGMIKEPCE